MGWSDGAALDPEREGLWGEGELEGLWAQPGHQRLQRSKRGWVPRFWVRPQHFPGLRKPAEPPVLVALPKAEQAEPVPPWLEGRTTGQSSHTLSFWEGQAQARVRKGPAILTQGVGAGLPLGDLSTSLGISPSQVHLLLGGGGLHRARAGASKARGSQS